MDTMTRAAAAADQGFGFHPPFLWVAVGPGEDSGSGSFWSLLYFTDHDELVRAISDSNAPADASVELRSSQALIEEVYSLSGLTWDQIARTLGVSKRSVLLWAKGAKVSGRNLELLGEFAQLISALPARTPNERRVRLLTSENGRPSALSSWIKQHFAGRPAINSPSASPAELLG
jgi:DNA-binding XRE family transcriptional regulator